MKFVTFFKHRCISHFYGLDLREDTSNVKNIKNTRLCILALTNCGKERCTGVKF